MNPHRRTLLTGLGLAALAARPAAAQDAPAPAPAAPAPAKPAKPPLAERLATEAAKHRLAVTFDGDRVFGPGFDKLVEEGRSARFFMVGEEHGIAQVPALVGALMTALKPAGYSRLGLEISPPAGRSLDTAARGGIDGIRKSYADYPFGPAFYQMKEEAEMLARVRAALPGKGPVLFGLDYEVLQDRLLIETLKSKAPASAATALAALDAASKAGWDGFLKTRKISLVLSFSGDPAMVRAVRAAWPRPDAASDEILDTLEQTLTINQHYTSGRYFQSNDSRARFNRANWARFWAAESAGGKPPRMMLKFGAGHMMRGRSPTEVYDIGNLISETAALRGETSFNVMVIPANGGKQAFLNPETFPKVGATDVGTVAEMAIEPIAGQALAGSSTLFDLRPLRPLMPGSVTQTADARLAGIIHGYDMLLLVAGSTASTDL